MLELFRAEAEGQTQTLSEGLVALETDPNPGALLAEMMRAAHSLKGAARIVGLLPAESVAHVMEDVFVAAQDGAVTLGPAQVDDLLVAVDFLTKLRTLQEHEIESWKASVTGEVAVLEARLKGLLESDSAATSQSQRVLAKQREAIQAKEHAESEVPPENAADTTSWEPVPESPVSLATPAIAGGDNRDNALESGEFSLMGLFREELLKHSTKLAECIRLSDEAHDPLHAGDQGLGKRDIALQQEMIHAAAAIKASAQIVEFVEVQELAGSMEQGLTRWKAAGLDLAAQRATLVRMALQFLQEIAKCKDADMGALVEKKRAAMTEVAHRLRTPQTDSRPSESNPASAKAPSKVAAPASATTSPAPIPVRAPPSIVQALKVKATAAAGAPSRQEAVGSQQHPHHAAGPQSIAAQHLNRISTETRDTHSREVAAAMAPRNEATVRISADLLSSLTGLAAEILVGARQLEPLAARLTAFRQEQIRLASLLARIQSGMVTSEGVKMGLTPGEQSANGLVQEANGTEEQSYYSGREKGTSYVPSFTSATSAPSQGTFSPESAAWFAAEGKMDGVGGMPGNTITSMGEGTAFLPPLPGFPGSHDSGSAHNFSSGASASASVSSVSTAASADSSALGAPINMRGPRGYLIAELTRTMNANNEILAAWMQEFQVYMHRFGNTADRLYQDALATRMRPFGDGTHGFPRLVRDLARQLGKKVRMQILGEETKVDREILEKLEAPLTHLIRNALDHGFETPEERLALGKSEEGMLRLEARHRGGVLVVTLTDDGHGININSLRAKVVERGLETAEVVSRLSEAEVMEFLFLPGFSTAEKVTDVSGRGIGLDVVRHVVQVAGGSVNVHAKENAGCTFQISVPITRSVIKALLVRVADEPYALPLARIDKTARVRQSELGSMEGRLYLNCAYYGNVGLVSAQEIFKLPANLPPQASADVNIVVISDRMNRYGLVVDEFIGARDLVVRPLDARLGKVPDISAASVMDDGKIALVVDVDDVVRSIDSMLSGGGLRKVHQAEAIAAPKARRILVVDDSFTVREVERRLLESHGYTVEVAVDGMEGWNAVRSSNFDLLITDVDMPRMTGIDLVRNIKEDNRLKQLPVMIVSYKDRDADRKEGFEAGADYYFPKSSFHDARLVNAVEDLIGKAV